MSVDAVRAWRDRLAADIDSAPLAGLSPQGARLVVRDALGALSDEALAAAAAVPGEGLSRATLVTARTVSTAALEWLALLWMRGTDITWKVPTGVPGLSSWVARHAGPLPLTVTEDHAATKGTPLVVVLGSDATVEAVRAQAEGRVLGFGHRWSVAWVAPEDDPHEAARAIVRDIAAHDTRGCMAPAIVVTDRAADLVAALVSALDDAEQRWPVGTITPSEHAAIRARDTLARMTGRTIAGEGWRLHLLPAAMAEPVALPRCVQLVELASVTEAKTWFAPWSPLLSSQALGLQGRGVGLGAPRTCALGELQRPPLVRRHDGVDHLRGLLAGVS